MNARRILALLAALLLCSSARAGGPLFVAGTSQFDPGLAGTPLTWRGGQVTYFTDQGALSPALGGAAADSLVAAAFDRWTRIPTAAVSATHGGQLAEDVSGANFTRVGGSLQVPADIEASAADKPVAFVYDYNGSVTDAYLGAGASSADLCALNAAFGGPDNLGTDAHYRHALVIMNGLCVPTSAQVADFSFRLTRTVGRVLGLGRSQLNDDVVTSPPGSADALAGFPVMHPEDPPCPGPINACVPDPDQPRMDDRAALSRLYPVTAANVGDFSGRSLFAQATARVSGRVLFPDGSGMEGVNVVARRLDPVTHAPSSEFAASSVSGFLFRGDAGNRVTGYADLSGRRYDRFGSADAALAGFFDLAGLEIPDGSATADYQLTLEPVNPDYVGRKVVGPYDEQVSPSGTAQAVVVHLSRGSDLTQDISPDGAASPASDDHEPSSFAAPAVLPPAGEWSATISGYGDTDYFAFTSKGERTFTLDVIALDESGAPSHSKLRPALGIWLASDADGTAPRDWASVSPGASLTRLQHSVATASDLRLGIEDLRGDGRPDFAYSARLLYGDSVSPARISTEGGMTTISGAGFRPGMTVTIGGLPAAVFDLSPAQMTIAAPAQSDGENDINLTDPATGATAELHRAMQSGAVPGDTVTILGSASSVPLGAESALMRAVVTGGDGSRVSGATVSFTQDVPGALTLIGGCGTPPCQALTDSNGEASFRVQPNLAGQPTLIARIATNNQYARQYFSPAPSATSYLISPLDWTVWVGSKDIVAPVRVRVLKNGAPVAGATVGYSLMAGSAPLLPSSGTRVTDSTGDAEMSFTASSLAADANVQVCAGTGPAKRCIKVVVKPVADANLRIWKLAGDTAITAIGQPLPPITLRATDASDPGNPVRTAVTVRVVVLRKPKLLPPPTDGGAQPRSQPVILFTRTLAVTPDANGVATVPAVALRPIWGEVNVRLYCSAGSALTTFTQFVRRPASP